MFQLHIKPMTFDVPQRVEASEQATELGSGLRMELGNVTTRYYADPDVRVGTVAVYAPKTYNGFPEYVTTLDSPEQSWSPWGSSDV